MASEDTARVEKGLGKGDVSRRNNNIKTFTVNNKSFFILL